MNSFVYMIIYKNIVEWLVSRDFRYLGGIKDVVFRKHERSRFIVRPTSDVTPIAQDLYLSNRTTSVNK